jgi:hypothetical protein
MRLAAEDYETDKTIFEVRALLKPQSSLREPRLESRVMAMMAAERASSDFWLDLPAVSSGAARLRN